MAGKTIGVSTAAQLTAALKTAKGGETILLAPGNYGAVSINAAKPAGVVTIKSADPANDAVLRTLKVSNSVNLSFEDLDIRHPLLAGEADYVPAIWIATSKHITMNGFDITGSLDGNANNDGWGIRLDTSSNVMIANSSFQQLNRAMITNNADAVVIAGNKVTEVREGFDFADVQHVIIEGNAISKVQPNWAKGDHPDAIQFWNNGVASGSSDVIIRNNSILTDAKAVVQGIFVGMENAALRHSDFVVENNLYYGDSTHGISLYGVDNATVRGNTVISIAGGTYESAVNLNYVRGAIVEDNIAPMLRQTKSSGVTMTNNVDLWDRSAKTGVALEGLFTDTSKGIFDQGDFTVAAGSVAARQGAGFDQVAGLGMGSAATNLGAAYGSYAHVIDGLPATMHLV